ncbi:unnamed protein product [Protopolystoma xenopodis]|uniref:Uncharacterized protein n=1 Tax=Protopolystoma xenopodis TaxID=117903 RepID=A0A3S5AYA9_9PLAT|nr:unnamed protein product [Protopolystoma xenopodis]
MTSTHTCIQVPGSVSDPSGHVAATPTGNWSVYNLSTSTAPLSTAGKASKTASSGAGKAVVRPAHLPLSGWHTILPASPEQVAFAEARPCRTALVLARVAKSLVVGSRLDHRPRSYMPFREHSSHSGPCSPVAASPNGRHPTRVANLAANIGPTELVISCNPIKTDDKSPASGRPETETPDDLEVESSTVPGWRGQAEEASSVRNGREYQFRRRNVASLSSRLLSRIGKGSNLHQAKMSRWEDRKCDEMQREEMR